MNDPTNDKNSNNYDDDVYNNNNDENNENEINNRNEDNCEEEDDDDDEAPELILFLTTDDDNHNTNESTITNNNIATEQEQQQQLEQEEKRFSSSTTVIPPSFSLSSTTKTTTTMSVDNESSMNADTTTSTTLPKTSTSVDAQKDTEGEEDSETTTTRQKILLQQEQQQPDVMVNPYCPVTILSGCLGSGKTTFINYILHSPDHQKKILVIENEYGSGTSSTSSSGGDGGGTSELMVVEGVEDNHTPTNKNETISVETMIARDNGRSSSSSNNRMGTSNNNPEATTTSTSSSSLLSDIITLPNGCICCTVKDKLVTTLETLLNDTKVSQYYYQLDHIIIECSGLVNPGPLATLFWADHNNRTTTTTTNDNNQNNTTNFQTLDTQQQQQQQEAAEAIGQVSQLNESELVFIRRELQLNGILTFVDSYHIMKQLYEIQEASIQIAYADRIILNKIDLLEQQQQKQQKQSVQPVLLSVSNHTTTKQMDHCDDGQDDPTILSDGTGNGICTTMEEQRIRSVLTSINPTASIISTSFSIIPNLDWIFQMNHHTFDGLNDPKRMNHHDDLDLGTSSSNTRNNKIGGDHTVSEIESMIQLQEQQQQHQQQYDEIYCMEVNHHGRNNDEGGIDKNSMNFFQSPLSNSLLPNHQHHIHTMNVGTITVTIQGTVSLEKINHWFATILWPEQDEIPIMKEYRQQQQQKEYNEYRMLSQQQLSQKEEEEDDVVNAKPTIKRIDSPFQPYPPLNNDMNDDEEEKEEIEKDTMKQYTIQLDNNQLPNNPLQPSTSYDPYSYHNKKKKKEIFRIKGILSVQRKLDDYDDDNNNKHYNESPTPVSQPEYILDHRRYIVQAVYDLWDIQPSPNKEYNWEDDDDNNNNNDRMVHVAEKKENKERSCTLIFIGIGLVRQELYDGFKACLVE